MHPSSVVEAFVESQEPSDWLLGKLPPIFLYNIPGAKHLI